MLFLPHRAFNEYLNLQKNDGDDLIEDLRTKVIILIHVNSVVYLKMYMLCTNDVLQNEPSTLIKDTVPEITIHPMPFTIVFNMYMVM